MPESQDVVERLKAELARDKREEEELAALRQIAEAHQTSAKAHQAIAEAHQAGAKAVAEVGAELVHILRTARIWGPILVAALLGSDVVGDLVSARLDSAIGRSAIVEPSAETSVSAVTKEP